jgi:predicted  nucleic acid-binding Zn-ribbon protein
MHLQAVADIGVAGRRRSLLQSNSSALTDSLSQVLTKVDQLRVQQTTITTQMASLQTQVQQANQLAEQRAQDKTLEQLIQAGRADIQVRGDS